MRFALHHHSAENAFNLVDDLIEPFRPIVDLKVVSDNILEPLSTQNKKALRHTKRAAGLWIMKQNRFCQTGNSVRIRY